MVEGSLKVSVLSYSWIFFDILKYYCYDPPQIEISLTENISALVGTPLIAPSIVSCRNVLQVQACGRQKVVPGMGMQITGTTVCMSVCVFVEVGKRAALQLKELCTEVKFSW